MRSPRESLCPVCNWELQSPPISDSAFIKYSCPRCGVFFLTIEACEDLPAILHTDKQRSFLSYTIRRAKSSKQAPRYVSEQIERILRNMVLPSAHEQIDNLIRWMGETIEGPGASTQLNFRDHGAIAGSLLKQESFRFVLSEMFNAGLLDGRFAPWTFKKPDGGNTTQTEGQAVVTLSLLGWNRFEELKRGSASGNNAFMAMQYGDAQLDGIVDDQFRTAISDTGFTLRRLDDHPRAGLIDDRLRVEIRACRFLIADLSHGNRGAHWEAGYAEGLGKPVIYTCRIDVFNDPNHQHHPHFDTNHHLTVVWDPTSIEDSCEQLKATIRATMPDARQGD
jgi:hypothetical protein